MSFLFWIRLYIGLYSHMRKQSLMFFFMTFYSEHYFSLENWESAVSKTWKIFSPIFPHFGRKYEGKLRIMFLTFFFSQLMGSFFSPSHSGRRILHFDSTMLRHYSMTWMWHLMFHTLHINGRGSRKRCPEGKARLLFFF